MEYKSENKIHSTSSVQVCQNCRKDFTIEPDDFGFYETIKVPAPTWCPECRAMRRLIWRNERSLYHNVCAFSDKKIISIFSPETKLTVYERDIWWSDKWDRLAYGKEYDFSKPFFEQFKELMSKVPLANVGNTNCVNSEYGNHNVDLRNCYLVYGSYTGENVYYAQGAMDVRDSFDLYSVMKSEQCFEDTLCGGLYKTYFSHDSDDCINSLFLTSCINLQDCFACINLRHKSHCIFNKQYSKEEYEKKLATYDFGSYKALEKFKKEYNDFIKTQFRRFAYINKSVNVTGDNVINSKNSRMIFDVFWEVQDSKYLAHNGGLKHCYDGYGTGNGEYIYESVDTGIDASMNLFGVLTHGCLETRYTYMCYSSNNLFGCVGMQKENYCILNKKYSKEEYHKLLPKIIEHMNTMPYVDKKGRVYKYGEFFPIELSPFYYNETILQDYYPMTRDVVENYGFRWKEREKRDYKIKINARDLPDHIKDVDEFIVDKVIGCMHGGSCNQQCTEAFKILPQELQFYKKNKLALPRLCPNCRHFERLKKRNPLNLWHRNCMCDREKHEHKGKCKNEFETSYAPERSEIVYCEKCYQAEVY
ncbi:MAG: hypothetical protein AAB945_00230 [Patescibacteria group bacterium]